jgi:GT2 family glycosyltransferase
MNPRLVTIIMVTRNRPVSLAKCLGRTRALLSPEVQIIVFDDASAEVETVRAIIESHPNTRRLRSDVVVGPGEGRNRCVQAAVTPWCFCMDDDCYLETIPDLSRWFEDLPADQDIAVVGFRYCNLPAGDMAPIGSEPGESSAILGGASLLRRSAMLRTGGYLDWLVFAAEDAELAMRLRRLGYRIWYDPSVIVQHARSHEGRDTDWGNFYYVRNTLVINAIYGGWLTGVPLGLLRALRRGWFHAEPCKATWTAVRAGVGLLPKCFRSRRELFREELRFSREN